MVTCAVSQRDAELDDVGVPVVDDLGDAKIVHDAFTNIKPMMPRSLASVSAASVPILTM